MSESTSFEAARQARRITEQAVAWYIEQHEPLSERQRVAFMNWLRASPRHVAEYFAVVQMHGDMKAAAALKTITAGELVEQARRDNPVVMFPLARPAMPQARRPRAGRRRRVLASAAGMAAAVALAWLGGTHWHRPGALAGRGQAAAVNGVRAMTLADGTLVQLDRNGAIEVHFDAHARRIDVLRGHVLFDIGKDPARPMFVNVGGHVLQDIGTVFDVKREARGDMLTVISGRVRVLKSQAAAIAASTLPPAADTVADLGAGQQIELTAFDAGPVRDVQVAQATAWLPAEIRFQHETIGEVARRFNAYTRKPLVIENERIAGERISGIFHADNPQAFVAYLATLPNVAVIDDADRIRIVASRRTAKTMARL
jgi:transmembrane sensor